MAVNLSPVGGVAAQFFDNSGNVLTGGKIYTYAAGTTTNQATYTSATGVTAHSNPIILDASGRVPGGEIWLTDGLSYKFLVKTSTEVLIGSYDNIAGINSNFINFLTETEIQTATAGQTVFTLTTMQYQPSTNSLSVFVDGVNQYDGVTYAYTETSSTVVTFTAGLHVGALVKFTTAQTLSSGVTDASLVTYDPPFTGSAPTNVEVKLSEIVSLKDFGAIGDGVTNDTVAIQNAELNVPVYAPLGTYLASGIAQPASLVGKQYGYGQIETADGNKSAPNFAIVSSAPTSSGNPDSIDTAFNGDLSGCQFPVAQFVTGVATLGQPTTGYLYTPEAMPHYTYLLNSSGWNESLSGNGGRTGIAAYRTKVFQAGQGDAVCFNGSVFVTGTRAGSTNFLANPAGVLFNGDMQAGADGVYLNPYETNCQDDGYDVACIGIVNVFSRTNATGAKSTVWQGYRAQNNGSATCDALISATGKWVTGLDLAMSNLDFGATKAALSLKSNDRIYLNNAANASGNLNANLRTTVFNGDYIEYSNVISAINFVRGGSSKLQIASSAVTVANAELNVNIGSGSTSIIRARQLGFALPTGTIGGGSFDTATVTLPQLAEYVGYLVTRLHASTPGGHALIGN